MRKWLLIFVLLAPIIELWGILQVSDWLGGWTTFWLIIVMGIAGAYVAQAEGRKIWADVRRQMAAGQPPGRTMLDGLCVVVGGILLVIPGFISDIAGLVLLLPFTRPFCRELMLRWLEKWMRNGNFTIRRY